MKYKYEEKENLFEELLPSGKINPIFAKWNNMGAKERKNYKYGYRGLLALEVNGEIFESQCQNYYSSNYVLNSLKNNPKDWHFSKSEEDDSYSVFHNKQRIWILFLEYTYDISLQMDNMEIKCSDELVSYVIELLLNKDL